jgi:SAM-dependent methyltransferase
LRGGAEERVAFMVPSRRLRLALVLDYLEARIRSCGSPRLLDAGCGDGRLTLAMARRHPSWRLVGVDVADELLADARERAAHHRTENARFEHADLTAGLPESGFDVVMAIEIMSEIADHDRALQMLADALAPGGLLLVHVPERSWRPILPGSDPIWRYEVRHGYGVNEIAQALRAVGLEDVEVVPTLRGTATLAQEIRDRFKSAPLGLRVLLYPLLGAAVRLERWGITWGPHRALLAGGRRPQAT